MCTKRYFVVALFILGTIFSAAFTPSHAYAAPEEPPTGTEGYSYNGREITVSTDNTPNGRVYFNRLKIAGPNQNNAYATWEASYASWTFYQATTWGWWWKGNIRIDFTLDGYGARYCDIYIPAQGQSPAFVQYTGNNTCRLMN